MPVKNRTNAERPARFGGRKKVVFALLASLLVPLGIILAAEGMLRLAGYGYPASFFIERTIGSERFLTENDKFGWRFFPKELARSPSTIRFKAEKAPGTYRVFVFGESAALGDPKPSYGMGRYLEVLLRERYPSARFEVITVAMTAINSHAIVPIARECAGLGGDFWVIYMGNNEMMGPFGANPISGPAAPSLGRIRAIVALRGTRLGQAIEALTDRITRKERQASWEGMKTFLEHPVAPDAPERARVRRNFRANLGELIRLAKKSGATPVVCTVAGNLRDCAPFASMHGPQTSGAEWKEIAALLESQTNSVAALARAAAADTQFAETQFRLGGAALAAGDNGAAFAAFSQARDLDALPFRTDAAMNATIRAAATGLPLADVEAEFARSSPSGLPGSESFFDHVHFTFEGNYRVARLVADKIAAGLPPGGNERWATGEACNRALALTDWNRRAAAEHMLQRISEPPFITQSTHRRNEEALARQVLAYRASASADARAVYESALARQPDDYRVRENYSEFLELSGDFARAAQQWEAVARQLPYQHGPLYHLGRLLARQGKNEEARTALRKALELRPDLAEAMTELGQIAYRDGKAGEALQLFGQAARLRPNDSRLRISEADALAASGNRAAAMDKLREAIQIRPKHWEAHYLLGVELAATNRIPEAIQEFQQAAQYRPDYAQARFNLGVALAKGGKINEAYAEFRKTLELDPKHSAAAEYIRLIENAAKKTP